MNVVFNSIDIKGFLSISESFVELANQGTVYVIGKNEAPGSPSSNGAGKSSLFEAIIFALTGTTLRGTTDVVNMYWKGYAEVTLDVSVDGINYLIKRTRNHPDYGNNLKLVKDNIDISGDKLRKSETILETELGALTNSLISSVIILGQGLPNKFTDLKPAARKDRLEELSQTSDFIDELKVRLTNFLSNNRSQLQDNKIEEGKLDTSINYAEDMLKRKGNDLLTLTEKSKSSTNNEELYNQLQERLKTETENLDQLNNTLKIVQEKLNTIYTTQTTNNSLMISKQTELSRLQSQVNKISTSTCPTCGQYISSPEQVSQLRLQITNDISNVNNEIGQLTNSNNQLQMLLPNLESKVNELSSEKSKLRDLIDNCKSEIMRIDNEDKVIKTQIESITQEISDCRTLIEESNIKLTDTRTKIAKLNTKIDILDYINKKASKEFRGYLLKGVVSYLNNKVKDYGSKLFGTEGLSLNLEDNKIFIDYENRPYENLSGGEKQRADLAMQFALRDMLINNLGFSCNLLVIDEGFDNLDDSGVQSLIDIINSKLNIDSVFTISHHTLSIPFDKTLQVTKGINKTSTIEELI